MILQNNVKKIIAVCKNIGQGYSADTCQYFPNETKQFSRIALNGICIMPDDKYYTKNKFYERRRFSIVRYSDQKCLHVVEHIHFTGYHTKNVPTKESTKELVEIT